LVQPELHPSDEGREVDGNSREPHADTPAARVPETVGEPERLALHLDFAPDVQQHEQASLDLPAPPASPIQERDRLTSPGIRYAQVKEELVAWVKTLVSAAVYAVLIVTFGVQVARVEGLSMAPTLDDQDRLIVNKLV